ncbi:MAG: [ribosomal protein S5]-alanine N-acetyltransferase [Pyrinomonadaceae bacterium]|nr:[ribosomal protein S5]-alanine N-acetyltransferase [Pyrinomonadaceae bacterium]
MENLKLKTERLELVAGTAELFRVRVDDREFLRRRLGARVPDEWPPPLYDQEALEWMAKYLDENPDAGAWTFYFIILAARDGAAASGTLIGGIGYKGKPSADGTVEIGYSMLPEFQRAGYATEAAGALIRQAFSDPHVARVIAETYPELRPSIRVLEKNNFRFIGDGSEERVIRYALTREEYESEGNEVKPSIVNRE